MSNVSRPRRRPRIEHLRSSSQLPVAGGSGGGALFLEQNLEHNDTAQAQAEQNRARLRILVDETIEKMEANNR